jgi:Domain of unknown function (DUF5615)
MKLLVDMNLSPLWIPFLKQHGFEAIHWSDLGPPTAPDTEIMECAIVGGSAPSIRSSTAYGCFPSEAATPRNLGVD